MLENRTTGQTEKMNLLLLELRAAFEATADVVMVLDKDGRYLNTALSNPEYLYKPPADLAGRTLHEVFDAEQADYFLAEVRRALEEGRKRKVEYSLRIDDKEVWFDSSVSPISDDTVVWVSRDITDRKRTEKELLRQLDFTAAITSSLGEGVYALDKNGSVTFMNPAAERLLGWRQEELLGKKIHEVTYSQSPDDGIHGSGKTSALLPVMQSGNRVHVDNDIFVRKDGTTLPVSYTAAPIVNDGQIAGVVLAFDDVTDRRLLEEQFRQAQKMEAVGRLAGGIAHDFNNVLTVILGNAQLMKAAGETSLQRNRTEAIENAAKRAAALTQQLLAFSRKQVLRSSNVELGTVVEHVRKMLDRLIPENVRIETRLEHCWVHADPVQLEQVLINLAINAKDAMPNGGTLTIQTKKVAFGENSSQIPADLPPGAYAMLSVEDTGHGMSTDVRERIFEPFFTTKDVGKGTGLGLSMVYGAIKQSGGAIHVESEPQHGTTFRVYLPEIATEHEPATEPVEIHATGGSETILVVEDDARVRCLVTDYLTQAGYRLIVAANGSEGEAKAREWPGSIDLVLTDVVMPERNGQDLAKLILESRPETKVLYMSGYAENMIRDLGVVNRGVDLIEKPFGRDQLCSKVRQVLDRVSPTAATKRILVVDDDEAVLGTIGQSLEDSGFEVHTALNEEEARTCLKKRSFRAVITDLLMPPRDGFDLASEIRWKFPETAIIAISGSLPVLRVADTLDRFDAILAKPLDSATLVSALKALA